MLLPTTTRWRFTSPARMVACTARHTRTTSGRRIGKRWEVVWTRSPLQFRGTMERLMFMALDRMVLASDVTKQDQRGTWRYLYRSSRTGTFKMDWGNWRVGLC